MANDEMDESISRSFAFRISNIQQWVSATLANKDNCTQGFSETAINGDVNATARTVIKKVASRYVATK